MNWMMTLNSSMVRMMSVEWMTRKNTLSLVNFVEWKVNLPVLEALLHPSTGKSPSELIMNRRLKTKVPARLLV